MWVFVGCVMYLLNVDHLVWGAGVSTGREVDSQRSRLTEGKHLRLKSPLLIYNLEVKKMRNHIKIYHEDMAKNAPQVNTIYK